MGDSPRYRPRSAYAQPGEIDTSLVEAESLRPRPAAKLNPNRPTLTPLSSIPESRPTAPRPVAEWERKSLESAHAAESRPRRYVRTRRQIHFTRASLRPGTWNRAARASPPHRELSKENQLRFTWASIQVSAAGTPRYKEAWRLRPELPRHLRSHCGRSISTRRSSKEDLLRRLPRA